MNIKEWIEEELERIHDNIETRAKFYKEELTEDDIYDLHEIDSNSDLFEFWDCNDLRDHDFDLGQGRAYQEILNLL